MNIFERAARGKWRYQSSKGDLTTEQLFDVPLTSKNGFDLNDIAIRLDEAVNVSSKKNFVSPVDNNSEKSIIEGKFEVVKEVIKTKLADLKAAETRKEKSEKRHRILEAIAKREVNDLESKTIEELEKELAALD